MGVSKPVTDVWKADEDSSRDTGALSLDTQDELNNKPDTLGTEGASVSPPITF